jgi:hypothetical protein
MLGGLTVWHLLILLALVIWIVALVQIARSKGTAGAIVGWIAVVTLLPVVGPIIWFAIGRRTLRSTQQPT